MVVPDGNAAQVRIVAEQVADLAADQAVSRFIAMSSAKSEIPAPLKWAGGIAAAVFTAGVVGMAAWLVSSVGDMQVTLARMDERQMNQGSAQETRFVALENRVSKLEAAKQGVIK